MNSQGSGLCPYFRRLLTCDTISCESILSLYLPLLIESALTSGFSFINATMISSSGMTALAAVNLVNTYIVLISQLFTGLAIGGSIRVAQHRGAGDTAMQQRAGVAAIQVTTLFSCLLALLSILFQRPITQTLYAQAEQDLLMLAGYYMRYNCLSLPLLGLYAAQLGVLRGRGEGKRVLFLSGAQAVTQLLCNIVFLSILKLGVTGLLLSLTVTRAVSAICCFLRKKGEGIRAHERLRILLFFRPEAALDILKVGLPVSAEGLLVDGGNIVLQTILVSLGTQVVATFSIVFSILAASEIPNSALLTTMYTVAGVCKGSNRPDDCRYIYKNVFRINTVLYLLIGILVVLFHQPLADAFHAEEEMYSNILSCLSITMAGQVLFHTAAFMTPNVLRAFGDALYPTVVSALVVWIVRILGAYVLSVWCGMGVIGVFIAMCSDWCFRAVLFRLRLRRIL